MSIAPSHATRVFFVLAGVILFADSGDEHALVFGLSARAASSWKFVILSECNMILASEISLL
eukprot:m.559005 g.559005  ORF g.559005 m.559005 type:complete len:62 (+) comp57764_c0_seq80:1181-1366(+)